MTTLLSILKVNNLAMLLGYEAIATDAKNRLLGDKFVFAPKHPCNKYRSIYDINFLPDNFNMPKGKRDFYVTAEGFFLVSEMVRQFCKKNKYKKLKFVSLPNSNYYWLKPGNIIKYDCEKGPILFSGYSQKCKGYKEVSGGKPVCLISRRPLADNFHRTDIMFGSIDGKSPIICIGIKTYEKIKKAGLKGLYVNKILDHYKKLPDMNIYKKIANPNFSFLDILKE